MAAYRPSDLDALCTAGEVVWVGAGALGATDGRVRLVYRDQLGLLVPPADAVPEGPVPAALLAHLDQRGASFWPELVAASAEEGAPYDEPTVLTALWDLVWAGLVTNDSLAPLRAFLAGRPRRAVKRRPAPGRLTRLGPPAAAGRWSLVDPLRRPVPPETEAAHARAQQLLARYGVLTREAALGEGAEGGFAGVYPVLKALEDRGQVRRGYFVAGLGGAQFALPGAVDRLRAGRDGDGAVTLAAADPAQPFGAALPWPETAGRPSRSAGAYVVVVDGEPAIFCERGAKSLVTFPRTLELDHWPEALQALAKDGRVRALEVARIDGDPLSEHPDVADRLRRSGFTDGYRGLTFRP
jgi:ATP-dependent Lhr-like helicase